MNTTLILQALGGIGLFLLGMVILTDGLKSLAGDAMRSALIRFTRTPVSGALTGAATTALLQSSSATIVAAVGFVGAHLMTYPMALGIIFGANAGTTVTGWLVLLLGFKLKIGAIMPPLILFGVGLRLFGSGRVSRVGITIAGFALIFVGIDALQQGMAGLEKHFTPDYFPPDTWTGRMQLVLIGVGITLITQSSSAGVATAMAALYAGAVNFPQAAALVIGMDIGTTATAALATIGSSESSRRTGWSHVIYNCFTGVGALILLTPYLQLMQSVASDWFAGNPEAALVLFHSGFNLLGVIVVLPFTRQFANLMIRLIPEHDSIYTHALDRALLKEPQVALATVQKVVIDLCVTTFELVQSMIGGPRRDRLPANSRLHLALKETETFIDQIHLDPGKAPAWGRLISLIHTLDHLNRLLVRCDETHRARHSNEIREIDDARQLLMQGLQAAIGDIRSEHPGACADIINAVLPSINDQTERARDIVMNRVAAGDIDVPDATDSFEAIRWLQRVSAHIARITQHLDEVFTGESRLGKY